MKHAGKLATFVAALLAIYLLAPSAEAANYQNGWRTGYATDINGIFSELSPATDFHPNANSCIGQAVLLYDQGTTRQVEVGVAKCKNAVIDGTCGQGDIFVEVHSTGNNYTCFRHGTFVTGDRIDAEAERASASSDTVYGNVNGIRYNSINGFTPGTNVAGFVWGENANTTTCGNYGTFTMKFYGTMRLRGNIWLTPPPGPQDADNNNCTSKTGFTSDGNFHIYKPQP